jgi:type II secretory pathway pseudopilin PulG
MTRRLNPERRGWSLLELLIVLAVMVGIVGIVFPRLTRPLAESEVQRAAADFRDHLVDCRQTAVLSGRPLVLSLKRGTGNYLWGEWDAVLAEGTGLNLVDDGLAGESLANEASAMTDDGSVTGSDRDRWSVSPSDLKVRQLSLPPGMVFEAIHRAAETPASAWAGEAREGAADAGEFGAGESLPAGGPGDLRSGGDSAIDRGRVDPLVSGGNPQTSAIESGRRDYLSFLPSGQSRDCVVVFRESASGMRAALEMDAITGMTRLVRLPAVAPEVNLRPTGAS